MNNTGKVFLVGAGPGDPGLITVRGLELVRTADVIVHDQLGAPAFLGMAKPGAELVDVGKRSGDHTLPQDGINSLLVERAKAGKLVVRLKGGDPLVFGRGGEEMEELHRAGVSFEVVPGVTSAIAGPAYAGIPITHRSCTPALAIVTGHEADGKGAPPKDGASNIPWNSLAGIGTVVFLMGVKTLGSIARHLVEAGKPAETPVAVIERATTPLQRTVTGRLADIDAKAREAGIKSPALIVVGDVVRYREQLAWFESRPLFGRTIVVTRARTQTSDLTAALRARGADVIECPTIQIEPLSPNPEFDVFIKNHEKYNDLVFTSVNGVDGFVSGLLERGCDLRVLAGKRIVCIGPATGDAFRTRGIIPDAIPETYVAESLIPLFEQRSPGRVAVLRAEQAREILPDALRRIGYAVDVIPLYRTLYGKPDTTVLVEALRSGRVDAVTFTSSSTVERFLEALDGTGIPPGSIPGVAIGPVTAETCRGRGVKLIGMACEYTIPGLLAKLDELLSKNSDEGGRR
ncbi:MAG TPA: uroporphyrinogen-III C-methyltransferase [Candidatus Ozemobacteraceae bacterium]|nr:uroporphyrinogen-III C-methyltransferase [Candidatus Ozemobacteraceae bacterium]